MRCRLGVNIDHIATLRNARGEGLPSPLRAAKTAMEAGADQITAHLREDRRHIKEYDLHLLLEHALPLNLEMAATEEMVELACQLKPQSVCFVPEKREELTTEGGLSLEALAHLSEKIETLKKHTIKISLFLDPIEAHLKEAKALKVDAVELHTGLLKEKGEKTLTLYKKAAYTISTLAMEVHAGHGLDFQTLPLLKTLPIQEVNIGHFIVGEALFLSLHTVVQKFRTLLDDF